MKNINANWHDLYCEIGPSVASLVQLEHQAFLDATRSPIEKALALAFMVLAEHDPSFYGFKAWNGESDSHPCDGWFIQAQVEVGPYTADFMFTHRMTGRKIAVECDGAAFHDTPDQWVKDKRRDRYFQDCGILARRYTGSEILASPGRVAREILEFVDSFDIAVSEAV